MPAAKLRRRAALIGLALLVLAKPAEPDIYFAHGGLSFVSKQNPTFDKDLALVKRCTKILEDPNAALKGKNAEDRFLAAAMLVAHYRSYKGPNAKQEPIDAE